MEAIRKLVNNAWKWNLFDFAREAGLDAHDESTKKAFLNFQKAADALRQLDENVMAVVTGTKAA
jgi:hypothetical protein